MESHPLNSELPNASHPQCRLFYWGIGFWMLAWIAAVCSYQEFELNVKGWNGLTIGVGVGSIVCQVETISRLSPNLARVITCFFGRMESSSKSGKAPE